VLLAIIIFILYTASAWVMLRSVSDRRLDPLAWSLSLIAILAHSYAIIRPMHAMVPISIGLLEAISMLAWTLAVLACLIGNERQNR